MLYPLSLRQSLVYRFRRRKNASRLSASGGQVGSHGSRKLRLAARKSAYAAQSRSTGALRNVRRPSNRLLPAFPDRDRNNRIARNRTARQLAGGAWHRRIPYWSPGRSLLGRAPRRAAAGHFSTGFPRSRSRSLRLQGQHAPVRLMVENITNLCE